MLSLLVFFDDINSRQKMQYGYKETQNLMIILKKLQKTHLRKKLQRKI
jgi:hypothetical protein